jgi:hypothetical protein
MNAVEARMMPVYQAVAEDIRALGIDCVFGLMSDELRRSSPQPQVSALWRPGRLPHPRRGGSHAEGRVNVGRAGSIGRRRIIRWGGAEGGGAGRPKISRGSCGCGGGVALRRSMK